MSGLTNHGEDIVSNWLFTATAVTRPTTWFVALHTADPTESGAADEVVVGTDADYVRKSITFDASSGGQCLSAAQVSWTVASTSGGYTVTHASIWDAATAGNCLIKGALFVPRALVADGVLTFNVGEVIGAMD